MRFTLLVIRMIFAAPFVMIKANYMNKHREKYDVNARYQYVQKVINMIRRKARTTTITHGEENLPKEDSYILMPNHQGKYDGLAIVCNHNKPLSVIMNKQVADMPIARHLMALVDGKKLDFNDPQSQLELLNQVTDELRGDRVYMIFPEGGYTDNKNTLQKFNTGGFRCAYGSECAIVPVALVDTYKAMNTNSLKKVITHTYYLEPIYFEEYGKMKRGDLCNLVKSRIQAKLDAVLG